MDKKRPDIDIFHVFILFQCISFEELISYDQIGSCKITWFHYFQIGYMISLSKINKFSILAFQPVHFSQTIHSNNCIFQTLHLSVLQLLHPFIHLFVTLQFFIMFRIPEALSTQCWARQSQATNTQCYSQDVTVKQIKSVGKKRHVQKLSCTKKFTLFVLSTGNLVKIIIS